MARSQPANSKWETKNGSHENSLRPRRTQPPLVWVKAEKRSNNAFRTWRENVARRRALADLTPDQLKDIGHPEAHEPVLDVVKAAQTTNLMSMR
ncbi:DUF1127 domain-containing protein [Mesorhizobium sp.]|uniref:DUF1127 domain-containing protein n=1 Tax=Mesorhizobium sp. TaxID=1871066 RepID=UPI0025FE5125|nr:DUF1127 domain-containing protein [Mesorhizobium sp.]